MKIASLLKNLKDEKYFLKEPHGDGGENNS